MDWPWNGGGVLLEVWVRLGDEFGTGLKELEGLDGSGKKRRKSSDFWQRKGGEWEALDTLKMLSLRMAKGVEGEG